MIRRDYIMRMLDEFSKFLAAVVGLKNEEKFEEALDILAVGGVEEDDGLVALVIVVVDDVGHGLLLDEDHEAVVVGGHAHVGDVGRGGQRMAINEGGDGCAGALCPTNINDFIRLRGVDITIAF